MNYLFLEGLNEFMHEIVWNFIEKQIWDNFLNFFLGLGSIQVFHILLSQFAVQYFYIYRKWSIHILKIISVYWRKYFFRILLISSIFTSLGLDFNIFFFANSLSIFYSKNYFMCLSVLLFYIPVHECTLLYVLPQFSFQLFHALVISFFCFPINELVFNCINSIVLLA